MVAAALRLLVVLLALATSSVARAQDCVGQPDGMACDDQLFCNGADSCQGEVCVHEGDPCAGGLECQNVCDENVDSCFTGFGAACTDDGNPCTTDVCDGA